ncbi:MAG: hypothetical protein WC947_01500 [Elusimicrobiota bacterium]
MDKFWKFADGLFTVRFIGKEFNSRGVSIYDFATVLLSFQRLVNKAHLSIEHRLIKGVFPNRKEREMLSLQIGERRRESDAFSFFPLLTDPETVSYFKTLAEYVASGVVGYYIGDILDRLRKEDDEYKQEYIGSIHADVVNIVGRIDAPGGIERIEIGFPTVEENTTARFDEESKEYINKLSHEFFLGKYQTIKGRVYRLYPNSLIVTIRRSSGRKVNIYLSKEDFDKIRFYTAEDPLITFHGRTRYKFGIETKVITEFEADAVDIEQNG